MHGVKVGFCPVDVTNALGIFYGEEAISSRIQSTRIEKLRSLYNLPRWSINLGKLLKDP